MPGGLVAAELRQLRRQDAVERRLARMDALGHVAGFEESIQPRRLRAGEAQRALHAVGIQPERLRRAGRRAERAVGRGGMPEAIMRRHHRHAHAHRHFVAGDQRQNQLAPRQPVRLGQRQRRRHHHRTRMQQRALMRVVVVGGVGEDAVCQRRERGLRSSRRPDADHRRARRRCRRAWRSPARCAILPGPRSRR